MITILCLQATPDLPVSLVSPISVKMNRQAVLCDVQDNDGCWILEDFETWEPLPGGKMNRTRGPGARGVQMPEEDQFWIIGETFHTSSVPESTHTCHSGRRCNSA